MRKNLLAVISAVVCGILAIFIPLCVWHQVNFPGKFLTLDSLQEAMRSSESYAISMEDLSMTPFYSAFILSFAVSIVAYVFSKKRV